MPHCPRCPAVWYGVESICHCGACHHTFSGRELFDRHRDPHGAHGHCRDPADLPDFHWRDGMWRGPERPLTRRPRPRRP